MKERELGKLTGAQLRLYAERRSVATMSESTAELIRPPIFSREASDLPEGLLRKRTTILDRTFPRPTEAPRRTYENKETSGQKEKKGIFESLPGNVDKLALEAFSSNKERDQIFGVMALELNYHTERRSIKEWTDEQRALEYEDWKNYSEEFLQKETKKKESTPEEMARYQSISRVAMGVKEALLEGLSPERNKAVSSGDIFKKKREQLVDADKIKNKEIKTAFISLIKRIESGRRATPDEMGDLRKNWHKLEREYGERLQDDPQGRFALEKARMHVVSLNKDILARREQQPVHMQARADSVSEERGNIEVVIAAQRKEREERLNEEAKEARKKETSIKQDPVAVVEHANKMHGATQARAAEMRGGEREDKKEREEARKRWKEEKDRMVKNKEMKKKLSIDEKDDPKTIAEKNVLWKKYGWEPEDRAIVARTLGLDQKLADIVSQTMLLQGKTGGEAKQNAREIKENLKGGDPRSVIREFINDEVVLVSLKIPPEQIDSARDGIYQGDPLSMQEVAWQIATRFPDTFGEDGKHPVWERRYLDVDVYGRPVDKDGTVTDEHGQKVKAQGVHLEAHEAVNKENVLLWFRNRVNYLQESEPNERHNFYQAVALEKHYQPFSYDKMLKNMEKVFAGSIGEQVPERYLPDSLKGKLIKEDYLDLSDMMNIEAYMVTMVRNFHLAYDENKGSEEELYKQMQALYDKNHLTRAVWGNKPLWQFMTLLPEKFTSLDKMDGGVGASVVKNYLAYYHISDFDKLQQVLGSGAKLFTVEGLRDSRDKVIEEGIKYGDRVEDADKEYYDFSYKKDAYGNVIRDSRGIPVGFNNKEIDTIFEIGENGKSHIKYARNEKGEPVLDQDGMPVLAKDAKKKFINFVNLFSNYTPNPRIEKMIKNTILEDAGAGENLNNTNKEYAHLIASHLIRFTGAAARNDTKRTGYDGLSRLIGYEEYRKKMLKAEKKSGTFEEGSEEKEFWLANRGGKVGNLHTISQFKSLVVDPMLGILTLQGSEAKGPDGKPLYNKPLLFVMEELNDERNKMREKMKAMDPENKLSDEEKQQKKEGLAEEYRSTAKQMRFSVNAEQHYLQNMYNRGVKLNEIVRGGKGLKSLESYISYAPEVGVTFDRESFQKDFISMVTDTRYAFSTYGNLNYNMNIRGWDSEKGDWRWMSLAESMFGKNMLNINDFKFKGGEKGLLDPNRITKKSHLLYKQFLLTYVAGEFIASRQITKWSTDPRHDFWWYNEMLEVLSKIPGDIETNDKDMRNINVPEFFFTKDKMKWLKELTNTTKGKLLRGALLKGFLLGDKKQKHETNAVGLFFGAIFKY